MPTIWPNLDKWGVASAIEAGDLDCVETAKARLYEQFKGKANWTKLANVIGTVFQEIEDLTVDVAEARDVATATQIHLDWIGQRFGRRRNGLGDADYRRAIVARAAGLAQDGQIAAIVAALDIMGAASGSLVVEHWPAKISATIGGVLTLDQLAIIMIALRDTLADGVGLVAVSNAAAPADSIDGGIADPFILDSVDNDIVDADDLPIVVY